MNRIALRGSAGEVRWSYHRAASLGAWTLEGSQLSAAVTEQDALRLSQQPLTFVVARPNGRAWSWPINSVRVEGTTLYADVNTEERSA
jgi:hypothetical protein